MLNSWHYLLSFCFIKKRPKNLLIYGLIIATHFSDNKTCMFCITVLHFSAFSQWIMWGQESHHFHGMTLITFDSLLNIVKVCAVLLDYCSFNWQLYHHQQYTSGSLNPGLLYIYSHIYYQVPGSGPVSCCIVLTDITRFQVSWTSLSSLKGVVCLNWLYRSCTWCWRTPVLWMLVEQCWQAGRA